MAKKLIKLKKPYRFKAKTLVLKPKPYRLKAHPYTAEKLVKRIIRAGKKRRAVVKPKRPRKPKVVDAYKPPLIKPSWIKPKVKMKPFKNWMNYMTRIKIFPAREKLAKQYPFRRLKPIKPPTGRKWLGPYPNPLGPNEIFSIELSRGGKQMLRAGYVSASGQERGAERRERQLKEALYGDTLKLLRKLHEDMAAYGTERIESIVPLRSGDMRKSMKESLSKLKSDMPTRNNLRLRMFLYCDVPYAGAVDKMKATGSPHVRHMKSIYKKYPQAVDEKARGRSYYVTLDNLKQKFRTLYGKFLKDMQGLFFAAGMGRMPISMIRKMFITTMAGHII